MKSKCPECQFSFEPKKHLKNGITGPASLVIELHKHSKHGYNPFAQINEAVKTVCPNCKYEFPYKDYKFFGLLNTKTLIIGVILFICAGTYLLILQPLIQGK